MDEILSFGAGIQTTGLVILIAERKLQVDAVVFADTGGEKPETYAYVEDYIKPMLEAVSVPYYVVRSEVEKEREGLYNYCWDKEDIPSIRFRWCTDHFKKRPVRKLVGGKAIRLIGFSTDESQRTLGAEQNTAFPLIEMGWSVIDVRTLIANYGLPIPLKSSCYYCCFQPYIEWNWLKNNHSDLFEKALALEARYHNSHPYMKGEFGLLRGTPLWKMRNGLQPEMLVPGEYSCWEGDCGH